MEPPPTTTRPFTRPTDKPPLVTPSASPPPFRHHTAPRTQRQASWTESDNRHAQNHHQDKSSRPSFLNNASSSRAFGSVPPAKRAPSRAASTPKPGGADGGFRASSTASFASAGSSSRQNGTAAPEEQIDIHKERQASIMRLLDAWSQLDKHVKRLDEDDIVHLGTGKIIKDKGVLRGLRAVKFGDHAEEEEEEDAEDEEEDEEEEEDGEEDQLDTLRSEDADGEEEGELEIRVQAPTANMPPVTPTNPQDAEDLRAFLEVEKDIGTEPEDDPEDVLNDVYDTEGASSEVQDDLDQGSDEDEGETGAEEEILASAASGPEESDSEDELNCNWAEDEASVIIPLIQPGETDFIGIDDQDDDDVIEIMEPPPPPPRKESQKVSKAPKTKAQLQLYTPPHSRSSVQTPPDGDFVTPPPVELPPPDISPEIPIGLVYQPKPAPVHPFLLSPSSEKPSKPVFSSTSVAPTNSSISHQKKANERDSTAVPEGKKKFKLKPEVVIERKTPFQEPKPSKKKTKQPSEAPAPTNPSGKSKDKGKSKREKSVVEAAPPEEHVEEIAPPEKKPPRKATASSLKAKSTSSSKDSVPKPKIKAAKVPFPSSEEVVENVQPEERQPPPSPRKRKRSSTGKAPTPQVNAVASSSKVKIDHGSGYETAAEPSKNSKDARRSMNQRSPRKRKSKSRSRQPSTNSESEDGGPHSGSDGEDRRHYRHHSSRPGTFPPPPFNLYPFAHSSMYPPPPQSASSGISGSSASTSHHHGVFPPVPTMPNHQTQYIVSQVMQQLTAMATGHWGPMPGIQPPHPHAHPPEHPQQHGGYGHGPFTPTHQHQNHRRSKSRGPPGAAGAGYDYEGYGGDPYSTPTHHHHRGGYPMYPYMFNPDMSRGTAPPDTPEHALGSSSSVAGSSPAMMPKTERSRKKSLVERSRSRGRRVSFKANKGGRDASSDDDRMDVFASSPLARRRKGSWEGEEVDREDDRKKGKGKSKDTSSGQAARSEERRSTGKGVEAERGKKKKGKQRVCSPEEVEDSSEGGGGAAGSGSEGSESDDIPLSRGRGFVRGQTPGPSVDGTSRAASKSRA